MVARLNFDNLPNFEYHFEGEESGNTNDIVFLISQKNKRNSNS